ncbi:transporter substrate-binding domain-containing protein [Phyllobacterium endophyticum]|uniref:Amino acid ABC transporter n=1 Tax=Phyllobacterium endophyticum TaxID=1149773 RepID=A0A2P7B0R3_9HYPH|nr:transporter substrate-binding domain-containing protein [Phyllobacterium endophyticum]MBB3237590.1 polar amino acid transport system substrate-binding protein [Phyllobacterium endophyticum]PSH60060.1 amino acid ABC transporter [Phyllobacterium endophyticum]TYR42229.1 transporter substrate-binding domain-containing protein [Phyllobacterium endophyticum]
MHLRALATLAFIVVLPLPLQVHAESDFPNYWDGREHVSKPDLSTIERIRFLTSVDYPPFNFLDSTGRISGFNIDLVRAICEELAVTAICQIEARPWNELQQALDSGEAEAIIAGLRPTAALRQKLAFTTPYIRLPARFVTLKGTALSEPLSDALVNKTVGVVEGSVHQIVFADYFPHGHWVGYPSRDLMLKDLQAKKIDAVFGDGSDLSFWIGSLESNNCCVFAGGPYIAPQFLGDGMTIATARDNSELVDAFNFALKALEEKGTTSELYLRYFPVDFY